MKSVSCGIEYIDDFGAIVFGLTVEEFEAEGFALGDLIDVSFSGGVHCERVPYFNGYYVDINEPAIVSYPGYDRPTFALNCARTSDVLGITADETITFTLAEKGAALETMRVRAVRYSHDPADYTDPTAYINAREIRAGRIHPGTLYRCASPFDNLMNRAPYAAAFLEEHGIRTTLSLSETPETLEERLEIMPAYSRELYESGGVIPCGCGSDYFYPAFAKKVADGLRALLTKPFPCAVHCLEGKDRTGFVCLVIESLMGAEYDEIIAEFMQTYKSYYGITEATDPIRWNGFKKTFPDSEMAFLSGRPRGEKPSVEELQAGARSYLKLGGMTDGEIDLLIERLESGK